LPAARYAPETHSFVHPLIAMPRSVVGDTGLPEEHSLVYRDLVRARALDLPSGEAIAGAMGVEPLKPQEIGLPELAPAALAGRCRATCQLK
jgi:hypothetical protein